MDINRQARFAATPSLALFVNLKNVVCKIGEDAEVLMSLYDPVESKFIRSVALPSCCLSNSVGVGALALSPHEVSLQQRAFRGRAPLARPPHAAEPVLCRDSVGAAAQALGRGQLARAPGDWTAEF